MELVVRIFAALGVALGSSAYLGLMLRNYNAKRLFKEVATLSFVASLIVFYLVDAEQSFLIAVGLGGFVIGGILLLVRFGVLKVEDRYKQARRERGETHLD